MKRGWVPTVSFNTATHLHQIILQFVYREALPLLQNGQLCFPSIGGLVPAERGSLPLGQFWGGWHLLEVSGQVAI